MISLFPSTRVAGQSTSDAEAPDHQPTAALVMRQPVSMQVFRAVEPPKERGVPWISSAALFLLVAAITFVFLYARGIRSGNGIVVPRIIRTIFPGAGLGLRVEGHEDRLLLSWNQRSPIVIGAREAILAIDDGSQHREVHLGSDQLADGSVLYKPASDDVAFRLEVRGNQGSTTAESIRVLDGGKPARAGFAAPVPESEPVLAKLPVEQEAPPILRFVPARPTHQVLPNLTGVEPETLDALSEVDVEVRVDADGHVRNAHILTGNVGPLLARLLTAAAEKWTFQPAMRGSEAVESDHTIVFEFRPGSH